MERPHEIAFGFRLWHGATMNDEISNPAPKPLSWRRFSWLGGVIPAVLVGLDQLSKWATTQFFNQPMSYCAQDNENISWADIDYDLSPLMDIHLICNPGISWGLFQSDSPIKRWVLTAFAFLMTIALLYALRKTQDRLGQISLSFVIAGAVGNAIDRFLFGAVTDMIDFSDIGFNYVFNVADSYITVGIIGLFVSTYLNDKREKAAAQSVADKK